MLDCGKRSSRSPAFLSTPAGAVLLDFMLGDDDGLKLGWNFRRRPQARTSSS